MTINTYHLDTILIAFLPVGTKSHCQACREQWGSETHSKIREELVRCLDRIISLERNFTDAQDEISRLRLYLKVRKQFKLTNINICFEIRIFHFAFQLEIHFKEIYR